MGSAPISVVTTVSSFIAIAWYNVIVINVVILLVFKRWSGLYFYSLLIASWGIVLHQLGFLMQFFGIAKVFAESYVVMMVGWYTMVSRGNTLARRPDIWVSSGFFLGHDTLT